jgi:hypothetical protein
LAVVHDLGIIDPLAQGKKYIKKERKRLRAAFKDCDAQCSQTLNNHMHTCCTHASCTRALTHQHAHTHISWQANKAAQNAAKKQAKKEARRQGLINFCTHAMLMCARAKQLIGCGEKQGGPQEGEEAVRGGTN